MPPCVHKYLVLLVAISGISSVLQASEVTLAWYPNPEPEVAGYRIHYGTSSREYTTIEDVGNQTRLTLDDLVAGTTYFVSVSTYDTLGFESPLSAEASFEAPFLERGPVNLVSSLIDASFQAGLPVALEVDPSFLDDSVARVEFVVGGAKIGEVSSGPYRVFWRPPSEGSFDVTTRIVDKDGRILESVASSLTVEPPPAVKSLGRNAAGLMALEVNPSKTKPVKLYVSEDLISWDLLRSFPPRTDPVRVIDSKSRSRRKRYYRLGVEYAQASNEPPVVEWVSSLANADFEGGLPVTLEVNTGDLDGAVSRVEFFVDGRKVGEASSSPYQLFWNPSGEGSYQVTARVVDDDGLSSISDVGTINIGPSPSILSLDRNENGLTSVFVKPSAKRTVNVYVSNDLRSWAVLESVSPQAGPVGVTDPLSAGSRRRYYKLGVEYERAANEPPAVSLMPSLANARFDAGFPVNLEADASDLDGSVASVEFYVDGVKVGQASSGPYRVAWKPEAEGSYVVTARVVDQDGLSAFSSAETIIVDPVPSIRSVRRNTAGLVAVTIEPSAISELELYSSKDLKQWTLVDSVAPQSGIVNVVDPDSVSSRLGYYRLEIKGVPAN